MVIGAMLVVLAVSGGIGWNVGHADKQVPELLEALNDAFWVAPETQANPEAARKRQPQPESH